MENPNKILSCFIFQSLPFAYFHVNTFRPEFLFRCLKASTSGMQVHVSLCSPFSVLKAALFWASIANDRNETYLSLTFRCNVKIQLHSETDTAPKAKKAVKWSALIDSNSFLNFIFSAFLRLLTFASFYFKLSYANVHNRITDERFINVFHRCLSRNCPRFLKGTLLKKTLVLISLSSH